MITLRSLRLSFLWLALILLVTACGGGGGGGGGSKDGPGPVDPKPLPVSIEVTPANSSLPKGVSQQFTATAVFDDSTSGDVTDKVTWSSADSAKASVSATGLVKGEAAGGPVVISASLEGITGSTNVTVSNARLDTIDVSPATASVPAGMTKQFTAMGTYSDGTSLDISSLVSWSSSDDEVATLDATGLATSKKKSDGVTVTATLDTKSDTATLAVTDATLESIAVTPSAFSLAAGYEKDYAATGTYSDGSTLDLTALSTWTSSDETVATVVAGKVKAIKTGTSTIGAAYDGKSGSNDVTVTDAELVSIAVTADNASLAVGRSQTYSAQGTYSDGSTQNLSTQVVWSVSEEAFASISNADGSQGKATALAVGGPVNVVATSGDITGTAELTVTVAVLESIEVSADATQLPVGVNQQLVATGVYSDGSRVVLSDQVTWNSDDDTVADVSNAGGSKGKVTAMAAGDATISATLDGVTGNLALKVTTAVLVSIELEPDQASVAVGSLQQFLATGTYSDGGTLDLTDVVTWSSSDTTVAEISNADGSRGLVTTLAAGDTLINASYDPGTGEISHAHWLNVTDATLVSIEVTSDSETLFKGLKQQYTATGIYSDNSTADLTAFVTWAVAPDGVTTVASITSDGLLTALAVGGPVNVSATMGAVSGSTPLTVDSATLVSLALVPMEHALPLGLTVQYTATGTYSDDTELDLTNDVIWTSTNAAIASISNAAGSQGLATAVSIGGPVTIKATLAGVSASTTLSVTNATLSTLVVTPANLDLPVGVQQQYVATATFSDGSVQDVTQAVHWDTSNNGIASISNAPGSQGLAKTLAPSSPIDIIATFPEFTDTPATTTLAVNDQVVSTLEVRPEAVTCGRNRTFQFSAFLIYESGAEQNLTAQALWTSSNTRYASIGLNTGLAKVTGNPKRLGDTTITARLLGLTDTAVLTKIKQKTACTTTP